MYTTQAHQSIEKCALARRGNRTSADRRGLATKTSLNTFTMADLRHGPPVSHSGWLLKEGEKGARFRRYMRLQGTTLSSAHSTTVRPSFDVCVLQSPCVGGDRPREIVLKMPRYSISYFAETDEEYQGWIKAVVRANERDVHKYYKVGEVLGEGAFAQVHRAVDSTSGEEVAIKVVKKTNRDPSEAAFVLREMVGSVMLESLGFGEIEGTDCGFLRFTLL